MGEVNTAPEVAGRAIEDLTALEVDSAKGERLYKAAIVHTSKGATYRLLAKAFKDGKLDLVHYGCDLDAEGNPTAKWRIRRIMEQVPGRFDVELEAIKRAVQEDGEEVKAVWVHDLTTIPDLAAQGTSLNEWTRKVAAEIRK